MTITLLSPSQRIALILRERGREATPEQVTTWLDKMYDKITIVYPRARREFFDAAMVLGIELGSKRWNRALAMEFGEPLCD